MGFCKKSKIRPQTFPDMNTCANFKSIQSPQHRARWGKLSRHIHISTSTIDWREPIFILFFATSKTWATSIKFHFYRRNCVNFHFLPKSQWFPYCLFFSHFFSLGLSEILAHFSQRIKFSKFVRVLQSTWNLDRIMILLKETFTEKFIEIRPRKVFFEIFSYFDKTFSIAGSHEYEV